MQGGRGQEVGEIGRKYGYGLLALLLVFSFRVGAQLLQAVHPVSFLPPFDAWYSGALSYGWLLGSQILILVVCSYIVFSFLKGEARLRPGLGKVLVAFGLIYFFVMLFRLVAGFSFASGHSWLGARIPAFFHLVLASFILLLGRFHLKCGTLKDI